MLLSIILPPVSVLLNAKNPFLALIANLFFCAMGFIPGIIHAIWVRGSRKEEISASKDKQSQAEVKLQKAEETGDKKAIKQAKKEIEKEKTDRLARILTPFLFIGAALYLANSMGIIEAIVSAQ